MGFLDFLGKKEPELKIVSISFSELPSWVENHKTELKGGIADNYSDELGQALEKIGDQLDNLEKASVGREVQKRIESIVVSSRDNYVSKLRKSLDEIKPDENPLKLSEDITTTLGQIQKIDLKYGQRAGFGFVDEVGKVKKELNKLVDISNKLNESLDERKKKLSKLRAVETQLKNINGAIEEINKLEERRDKDQDELRESKHEKALKEKNVDDIEHSEQAETVAGIESELKNLKARKQELESLVLNILGPLKRVFKKFARAVAEGKASGINVDRYAEDPVETYLRGEHTLPDLLVKIQKAIQTGTVTLEGNEGEKTVKKIRAISFSYLEKTRSEYNEIVSKIRTLELRAKELSVTKELERVQREADSLNETIESAAKRIDKREEEIEGRKLEIESMRKTLTDKISDFIGGRCELV